MTTETRHSWIITDCGFQNIAQLLTLLILSYFLHYSSFACQVSLVLWSTLRPASSLDAAKHLEWFTVPEICFVGQRFTTPSLRRATHPSKLQSSHSGSSWTSSPQPKCVLSLVPSMPLTKFLRHGSGTRLVMCVQLWHFGFDVLTAVAHRLVYIANVCCCFRAWTIS